MEEKKSSELSIIADPERLEEGSPEEQACFAAIGLHFGNIWLTEGHDGFVNKVRSTPLLSGYHLAEWTAWNWWRLRWEPRSKAADWDFAHRLSTIGEGYVWPNITIFSDGERIAILAKPTPERANTMFRYLCDAAVVVPAREFEYVLDRFIEQVRGLLHERKIVHTNLDKIWRDIVAEREDNQRAKRRKLEALLGRDPDQAGAEIETLLKDVAALGELEINELAADHPQGGTLLTAKLLREAADSKGFDASPHDVVRLASTTRLPAVGESPAWMLGAEAAKAVRGQEGLGSGPIENDVLAKLAGVQCEALNANAPGPLISFALDKGNSSRIVLRSKWGTGRRFDLARLVGDRVASPAGRFFPATRAHTYRQKVQRSFAAELLSPFESVEEMLHGDFSIESREDVAESFRVSEWTIRTLLVNHHRLEREDLDVDFDAAAA
jgi:hypothetical protein